ncbi:hypothetical protein FRC10_011094 [Ceratobasidium sp. 414]|nr:hypothetical protein FRC10_011094 [Ceratobasidium sp. 414]
MRFAPVDGHGGSGADPEGADGIGEAAVEALREAGALPPAAASRKGKGVVQSNLRHIVFVDDEDATKRHAGPSRTQNVGSGDGCASDPGAWIWSERKTTSAPLSGHRNITKTKSGRQVYLLAPALETLPRPSPKLDYSDTPPSGAPYVTTPDCAGVRTMIRGPGRAENEEDKDEVSVAEREKNEARPSLRGKTRWISVQVEDGETAMSAVVFIHHNGLFYIVRDIASTQASIITL